MTENAPAINLADLAGIDVTEVDELRFEVLPKMSGKWKVKDCKIEAIGAEAKPAIIVMAQPIEIAQVLDDNYKTPEDIQKLTEKEHREGFFVNKAEDVGRFKAFVVDAGVPLPAKGSGQKVRLDELCNAIIGMEFPGKIEHRADKKQPDIIRANLRPIPVKPEQTAA